MNNIERINSSFWQQWSIEKNKMNKKGTLNNKTSAKNGNNKKQKKTNG